MIIKKGEDIHFYCDEPDMHYGSGRNPEKDVKWVSVESLLAWAESNPHDTFEEFLHQLRDQSSRGEE